MKEIAYIESAQLLPERAEVLAAEINVYKAQAGMAIIEIGKRLIEVRGMLPRGSWTAWLKEKVDFSERTAQNFMRVAEEYIDEPQALADLGYTKAVALLALAPGDREEFLTDTHTVEGEEKSLTDMSTREFERLVRERDEAIKKAREAEQTTIALTSRLDAAVLEKEEAEAEYKAEWEKNDELGTEMEALLEAASEAREREAALKNEIATAEAEREKLKEQLLKAKEAKKKADEKLKAQKENPEVDPEVLERLKKEAEDAALAAAELKAQERLKSIESEREKLTAQKEAAAREKEEADRRIAELEKQLATASPEVKEFSVYFGQVQEGFNRLFSLLHTISEKGQADTAQKLSAALIAALDQMRGRVDV